VITTVSVSPSPSGSITIRVAVVVPNGKVAMSVGLTGSSKLIPGADQEKVKRSPSGSLDSVPSKETMAPAELVHSTIWSGPASAVGGRFHGTNSNDPISQFVPWGRAMPRWSVAGQATLSPASMAGLPGSSAWVKVGPALSCKGSSRDQWGYRWFQLGHR